VGDVGGAINVGLTLTRSVLTGAVGSTGPPGPAGATGPPGPAGALNVQYRSVQAVRRRPNAGHMMHLQNGHRIFRHEMAAFFTAP